MTEQTNIRLQFANLAGAVAESFSFNRSIGQLYGLLYISPEPLSLDDMAAQLSMSKGNASINLRILESWGAVQTAMVPGSRRDYYSANKNLKELVARRLQQGLTKRLDFAEENLNKMNQKVNGKSSLDPAVAKQLKELESMLQKGKKILASIPKLMVVIS